MITKQTTTVYFAGKAKRRYLTLNAACRAEARAIIKRKYPTEEQEHDEGFRCIYPGFYWHELDRSDVMYRRLTAKIKKAYKCSQ